MEQIIHFFRDTLDGPVYIAVAVVAGILLCACIGYLAEKSIKRKKMEKEGDSNAPVMETKITTPEPTVKESVSNMTSAIPARGTIPEVNTQASPVQQPTGQPASPQAMPNVTAQVQQVPAASVIPTITIPTENNVVSQAPSTPMKSTEAPQTISTSKPETIGSQSQAAQSGITVATPIETNSTPTNAMPSTIQQPITSAPTMQSTVTTANFSQPQTLEEPTNTAVKSPEVMQTSSIVIPFASPNNPQASPSTYDFPSVEQSNQVPVEPNLEKAPTVIQTIAGLSQENEQVSTPSQNTPQP